MFGVFASLRCLLSLIAVFGSVFLVINALHETTSNDKLTGTERNFPWHNLRLPRTLIPLNYEITLQTDLNVFYVKGFVKIRVQCMKTTRNIILHLRDMDVTKTAVFEKRRDTPVAVKDIYEDEYLKEEEEIKEDIKLHVIRTMQSERLEMFLIEVNKQLTSQRHYDIYIRFEYPLTDDLLGFYRSYYIADDGEKRYLAATLFEPTDARKAFPCFDEPAMKSTFQVTIIRQAKYTALSNMPLDKTVRIADDLYADHFKESKKMSTYLVAFLVSDFRHLETITATGIKVRMWAPPSQVEQGTYALEVAAKTLTNYDNFFKIRFPLPKQDLVAIPDFGTGAMENWGLIGFSSAMVLYDPMKTSDKLKQVVCETVTHELAHQWFGNLVTMKWWSDLWLNEGFATYMENIGSDLVEPEWSMMDQFLVDVLQTAFAEDQSRYSHPISVNVKDPKDIDSIFDAISYQKGASIIRMLRSFLGSDAFTSGLQLYLKKYSFKNADTDYLWECLSEKSAVNVKEVMDTWTIQMGLPVVTIKRIEDNKATADQNVFLILPGAKPNRSSPFNYSWHIPLTYITEDSNKSAQLWMNRGSVSLNWPSTARWIKANVNQIGYYRVNYDNENWRNLCQQLNVDHKVLSAADRSGLIDDAFHLSRSNQLDQTIALSLTEYIENETDYSPLTTFMQNMKYIGGQLALRDSYRLFKAYMLQKIQPEIQRLGWEDKGSHLDKLLRPMILWTACECGDTTVISKIKDMFRQAMAGHKTISSNLRSLVYCIGVREGSEKEWNQVFKKYSKTHIASDRQILLDALTYTRNPQIVQRLLKYSLDNEKIRSQDTLKVISNVALDPQTWRMAWNFTRQNWDILYKRYCRGSDLWPWLISSLMIKCNTHVQLNELMEFFKDYKPTAAGYREVQMGMEEVQANILWLHDHEGEVAVWFKAHVEEHVEDETKTRFSFPG